MSDSVKCDGCDKYGRRRRMFPAPDDWFFIESQDDLAPEETYYVYACSAECCTKLWQNGPGRRFTLEEIKRGY